MAEKPDQEKAAKDRIVKHMNKDHHDSVSVQLRESFALSTHLVVDRAVS